MQQFAYTTVNGYGIAHIGLSRFLIEPGLPYSIADHPLEIEGQRIEVQREVNGLTAPMLSRRAGVKVDGALGANLGEAFVVSILPRENRIQLDRSRPAFPINIQVDSLGGVATMDMYVGGRALRGMINLGGRLSLIQPELVESLQSVGRSVERLSLMGETEVDVYELPVMIDTERVHLRFAAMPRDYALWMEMANVQAVLGHELLEHYSLALAMGEGILSLDPLRLAEVHRLPTAPSSRDAAANRWAATVPAAASWSTPSLSAAR